MADGFIDALMSASGKGARFAPAAMRGTVESVDEMNAMAMVVIDGDTDPTALPMESSCFGIAAGDRVRIELIGREAVVVSYRITAKHFAEQGGHDG